MWDKNALSMLEQTRTPELKRKELELELVKLVQSYQRDGLDIDWISIDLLNGVDARVNLNETPNIQEQVTDATGTRTNPEES
ncbi:hypothetical protein APD02_19425 [Acinetobacter baumannii]|uniref:Uncharacterized protein n=1 Tax=Acinetobacter baumannii TaxID=470 RepID=A0AAP1A9C2_ACIBA|nr:MULTISPECIES: hypothetical protein [Acinetobacter]KQC99961.1 hypothetical protein APD02_19425 [Acinetobacter baumannii]KQD42107.1 hypothetical protein APD16_11890 [Acinetobacter baumannii]KQD44904.1 hypothetical protein APD17_11445 [Acinetobacter baumannii]KQD51147.1 hypothetical protein APD19_18650 [Acinetobacter baumannii]KQD52396.1 hypothetical protein APD20_05850 [Acinetobacter baumannii]